jgi:hypothetical protein
MKDNTVKKLSLSRETIRTLQDPELRLVAGGQPMVMEVVIITQAGPGCCPSTEQPSNNPAFGIMQAEGVPGI